MLPSSILPVPSSPSELPGYSDRHLVTGASSGIGRATALAFARERAKVVVADVTMEGGEETVAQVKNAGGEAIFVNVIGVRSLL